MKYVLGFYRDAVRELRDTHPRDMVIVSCLFDIGRLRGHIWREGDEAVQVGQSDALHPDVVADFWREIGIMKTRVGA